VQQNASLQALGRGVGLRRHAAEAGLIFDYAFLLTGRLSAVVAGFPPSNPTKWDDFLVASPLIPIEFLTRSIDRQCI
jgi:hypothetical protein